MTRSAPADLRELVGQALALVDYSARAGLTGFSLTTPAERPPVQTPPPAVQSSLEETAARIADCRRCPLHRTRTRAVPGEGAADARLMVIGEGPGATEDQTGRPFVGEAGEMLTRMLVRVLELPRERVFITNIVKCRPPGNRDPEAEEVRACFPFLEEQVRLIRPLLILSLGRPASRTLTGLHDAAMNQLRGGVFSFMGIEVRPTFHPAYLLRTPDDKRLAHQDLLAVKSRLEELAARGGEGTRA